MVEQETAEIAAPAMLSRFLPSLLLLFVGSGCAALVYEIVWYQLLELVIGSSAISLGVLLATFMGGLCAGSLLLPRLVSPRRHPLRVYAALESGIAVFGILVLYGMPYAGRAYAAVTGDGLPGILLRGLVSAAFLLVPTMLMGATLPAIARWVEATPRGVAWLGFFYGGNTAGAVIGCLLAGFYLLRVHNMEVASWTAVVVNIGVALISLALSGLTPWPASSTNPEGRPPARARSSWPVYVVIGLSGFTALGAEVVWTRLLSLMLGATVYTFSIILAVFLLGIGLGSGIGSAWARDLERPRLALGICQLCLTAAVAWTGVVVARSLPYWPINASLTTNPWNILQLDLVRCLWVALPAAMLWGASFPLALAAVAAPGEDTGRVVGRVYASNTVGAILGALVTTVILIPRVGTAWSQRILVGLMVVSALLALGGPLRKLTSGRRLAWAAVLVPAIGAALLLARAITPVPWQVIAYGRQSLTSSGNSEILYTGEGMNASVAISRWTDGRVLFHVSGKVEASSEPHDMRLQRMLGHLPGILHPNPRSVLIVGFGAGVTAGSFVTYPGIEKIVICEIEPLVPQVASRFFGRENYNVISDPRVKIVYDDARHYILTTKDTFDIITSDPIHPWVKGSATLYSKEYFEMCRRHLNPGGLISQWVPLYESNAEAVKSELATFFRVFPDGTMWGNDVDGSGYDSLLLGHTGPLTIHLDEVENRLSRPEYARVRSSLSDVGFFAGIDLLKNYAGRAADMKEYLKDAEVNQDLDLRLQYLAGMGLNLQRAGTIYGEILRQRKYPQRLFVGSDSLMSGLEPYLGQ